MATAVPVSAQTSCDVEMGVRLRVARTADLQVSAIDFGDILIDRRGGRVVMNEAGTLALAGGVLHARGFAQPGLLTLDAGKGAIATINMDPSVDMGGGVRFTPMASRTTVNLMGNAENISIFGAIDFPPNTQAGEFHGVLHISVTYN